jgi:hypothetical protein
MCYHRPPFESIQAFNAGAVPSFYRFEHIATNSSFKVLSKQGAISIPLAFSSDMEGVCSAHVQAQNKHSRGPQRTVSDFALLATFADSNIRKSRSVYY